jgi:predicted amidohydrolase YtcJ
MYFNGEAFLKARGNEAMRLTPPIMTALKLGIPIGGGTDAHRVMSYNPFVSLQWMVDGKTVGGTPTRDEEQLPTREEALRFYTLGSAWFTFDDERRGSLKAGKLADLAVLTRDYLTTPTGDIGATESVLTMVGGRISTPSAPLPSSRRNGRRLRRRARSRGRKHRGFLGGVVRAH